MAKSNMYDFSEVTVVPGWTVKEKCSFTNLVLKMSIDIRKKELTSKIAQLKREGKNKTPKVLEKEIDAVNRQITALGKKTLKDVALPIDQEYDWEIIANKLNKRHTASEYRSLWKVFLHPCITKGPWGKDEHSHLQEIAQKYNFENWDLIAKELNTGRTGYQCFVYYTTNMSNAFTGEKWTKEEEIEKRKGRFLPEEDAVILTGYDKFGCNFRKMSEYLPGRSAKQIRVRYKLLAKKRISTNWTVKDDKKLLKLMANDECLTNYSSISKYFPGKTCVNLRARFTTLLKWMQRHPNSSVDNAPRRGARRLSNGLATNNLYKATEKLKRRLESEIEDRKSKTITRESPLEVIEDAIIAILLTEHIKQEEERKSNEVYDEDELLVLDSNSAGPVQNLNATNLQKMIVFLRGNLNQDIFKKSSYADQYPGLLNPKQEVNPVQVKTYSRKGPTTPVVFSNTPVVFSNAPDIWGNNTLGSLKYVLPPNYATITGCRKLIEYVNSKTKAKGQVKPKINIDQLIRKPILKEQWCLLSERFNTLFLYPMLLSNVGPEGIEKHTLSGTDSIKKMDETKTTLNLVSSFSIPGPSTPMKARLNSDTQSEENVNIDLEQSDDQDKHCVKKVVVDDNNFRFLAEDERAMKKKRKRHSQTH